MKFCFISLLYVIYTLKSHAGSVEVQGLTAYVNDRKAYQTTTYGENWGHCSNGFKYKLSVVTG